jgi:hypothetical protein
MWWGILAAVIGASLGALLTYRLTRARPHFALDAIELTTSFPSNALVRRDDTVAKWAKIYWLSSNPLAVIDETATERQYVEALRETQRLLETELHETLPTLRKVADDIGHAINRQRDREVEAIWTVHDDLIFEALAVPYLKGIFTDDDVFTNKADDDVLTSELGPELIPPRSQLALPNGRQLFYAPQSSEKPILILLTENFNRYIDFPLWRAAPVEWEKLRCFAIRIAKSIAGKESETLLRLADRMTRQADYREQVANTFANVVQEALKPSLRYVAKGFISNSGRNPFSVHGRASLAVGMRKHVTVSGRRPDNLYLDMEIDARETEVGGARGESPILVGAGEAIRFVAVSREPAIRIEHEEDVRKAYEGGNIETHLTMHVTGSHRGKTRVKCTPDILFRDIEQSPGLGAGHHQRRRVRLAHRIRQLCRSIRQAITVG